MELKVGVDNICSRLRNSIPWRQFAFKTLVHIKYDLSE